ncbi:MAG: hypothetical protein J5929_08545 [Eubacterium sp.]|nr:hypothetical protein [Eubacterium sp.]
MPDRETIENRRIQRELRAKRARAREARRRRNIRVFFLCTIFSIIVIISSIVVIAHSISDKKEHRDKGIKAFNESSYEEALKEFNISINTEQWFSSKMDYDTELYIAACYMRQGEYAEASKQYKKLTDEYSSSKTSLDRDTIMGMMFLADALEQANTGDISDATISQLKKEYEAGNVSMSIFLGTSYQQMGNYEEMVNYYTVYADKFGINTYIAYQLSAYYLDIGDIETATDYVSKGMNAEDDLYLDMLQFNDIIITEKNHDYVGALNKARALTEAYPDNETYKREYDFLDSRVNIDTTPVHTESDAD